MSGFHLNIAGPSTQNVLLQYCVRRGLVMVADCAILPHRLSSLHSSCLSCSCTHAACWQICASQFSCDQCGKSIKLAKHLGGHKLDWLFNYHVSSMTQPPLHTLSNPKKYTKHYLEITLKFNLFFTQFGKQHQRPASP